MPVDVVGTPRATWTPKSYPDWAKWNRYPSQLTPEERAFPQPGPTGPQTGTDPEGRKLNSRFIAGGQDHSTPLSMQQIKDLAALLTQGHIQWVTREDTTSSETKYKSDWLHGKGAYEPAIDFNTKDINTANRAIPHETGHAIDVKLQFLSDTLDKDVTKDPQLNKEFHSMHFDYENPPNAREAIADALARYMIDPQGTKKDFPKAAKWLRDHINTDAMINRVITLSQNDRNPGQPNTPAGMG